MFPDVQDHENSFCRRNIDIVFLNLHQYWPVSLSAEGQRSPSRSFGACGCGRELLFEPLKAAELVLKGCSQSAAGLLGGLAAGARLAQKRLCRVCPPTWKESSFSVALMSTSVPAWRALSSLSKMAFAPFTYAA
jgi:hypothetical protein